jgi:SAM-dependent methyltransferase
VTAQSTPSTRPGPAEMYESFFGPAIFAPCAGLVTERAEPRPGEAALDLACGTGQVARRVAPRVGPEGRVTAVDLSPEMLAVARSLTPPAGAPIEWKEADAVELDLPDEAYDLVVCQQGLQFFPDRARALAHVRRVLRPEGRAVFATWRGMDRHPMYAAMAESESRQLERIGVDGGAAALPFSLGDDGELTRLFEDAGFTGVQIDECTVECRFPDPATWVRNMQLAYAAVIPAFVRDPRAFEAFVAGVEADTRDLVAKHVEENHVVIPMHAVFTRAFPSA